jgi:hypothetical protein
MPRRKLTWDLVLQLLKQEYPLGLTNSEIAGILNHPTDRVTYLTLLMSEAGEIERRTNIVGVKCHHHFHKEVQS